MEGGIRNQIETFHLSDFYYFAEIGIEASNRGSDTAAKLYRAQIESALRSENCNILVRTSKKTDLSYLVR